jgi:nitroreductase
MGSPQWSDVGMWLQTVMLLLREEGLDTCPQEFLSMHAKLIKKFIGVSDETHIFFCGIAIGYRDEDAAVNGFERQREPVEGNVRFIGF